MSRAHPVKIDGQNFMKLIDEIKTLADEILEDEKKIEEYRSDPFWDKWMKPRRTNEL